MSLVFLIACLVALFHGYEGWAVAFVILCILTLRSE